jgi:curved DNA-binding protein CbpA
MRVYTHYEILGVRPAASLAEIRQAYREKVKLYHPDMTPGAEGTRFRAVVAAWKVLSDPRKRKAYDLELRQSAKERSWYGLG